VCDLHHGLANALMIDTVMAWNYEAVPAKFDELAHVCKVAGRRCGLRALAAPLKASVGITGTLASHGVKPEHMPRLVEIAVKPTSATRPIRGPAPRRTSSAVQGGDVTMDRLKIGVSACFLLSGPGSAAVFAFKTCSMSSSRWRTGSCPAGALPVMIPSPRATRPAATSASTTTRSGSTAWCCTAAPTCGPAATAKSRCRPHWSGDRNRDEYEIALVQGLCEGRQAGVRHLPRPAADQRGLRRHAVPGHRHPATRALVHRDGQIYDNNFHTLDIVPGSRLSHAAGRRSPATRSTACTTRASRIWPRLSSSRRVARTTA
jgi:hypothetical protein